MKITAIVLGKDVKDSEKEMENENKKESKGYSELENAKTGGKEMLIESYTPPKKDKSEGAGTDVVSDDDEWDRPSMRITNEQVEDVFDLQMGDLVTLKTIVSGFEARIKNGKEFYEVKLCLMKDNA
jgi:hypothetical protein